MFNQNKNNKFIKYYLPLFLIILGIAARFLPHSPNFSPVAAVALFGGVYFSKKMAFVLPVAIMFISDIFIGFYEIGIMVGVYGSFLLCVVLGFWLKQHKKWTTILGNVLLASLIFFFLTNFSVLFFAAWYPKTINGLIECYIMAIPFFKNSLFGNLFYAGAFFGAYELIIEKEKFFKFKKFNLGFIKNK